MGTLRKHEHKPRQWTDEEHANLVRMRREGASYSEIGRAINRPLSSVEGRLKKTDETGKFISRRVSVPLSRMGIDDELLAMHRRGMSQGEIGASVGLGPSVVGARLRRLLAQAGEEDPENPHRKKRTCLLCREIFLSDGPQNRRCLKCQRMLDRSDVFSGPDFSLMEGF